MVLTVKDKDGKTFDSVESINFDIKVTLKNKSNFSLFTYEG